MNFNVIESVIAEFHIDHETRLTALTVYWSVIKMAPFMSVNFITIY